MRRAIPAVVAFTAWLVGCTFLISFDEIPATDAGVGNPQNRPPDVTVVDSGPAADRTDPPDVVNGDASADYSKVCAGQLDGKYCSRDEFHVDGGSTEDLVSCLGGRMVTVKACVRCTSMAPGYPDECDQCAGKADGLYCGDDFNGWHPQNANTRIRCGGNEITGNLVCANVCVGSGPSASCQ